MEKILKKFGELFSGQPSLYASPGRVNLIGEHTDYNEGFVLPGAIDKAMYLAIKPNHTDTINVFSLDYNQMVSFVPLREKLDEHWANYILGVVMELRETGALAGGFDGVFGGDIPLGAGLSSSAALESVFAFALNDLFGLNKSLAQLARIGQLAEHHYAGVRCGIMDQFASLHGQQGKLIKLDCRSLEVEMIPFDPQKAGYRLVLIDTMVKHSLASSEYNVRRQQCEAGVAVVKQKYPQVHSLRDISLEMLHDSKHLMETLVLKRCEYVIEENQRLHQACQAMQNNDLETFGKMMFGSHEGLRTKYEVSCKELDFLADLAAEYPGILGARMMGGGFGGCTINLVSEQAHDGFIDQAKTKFLEKFGQEPKVYDVVISDGARKL
ncbi:MAG: galactokinase [Bacteroidales bacterium]|nr:galactokinase [Bacteroidales bacterium]